MDSQSYQVHSKELRLAREAYDAAVELYRADVKSVADVPPLESPTWTVPQLQEGINALEWPMFATFLYELMGIHFSVLSKEIELTLLTKAGLKEVYDKIIPPQVEMVICQVKRNRHGSGGYAPDRASFIELISELNWRAEQAGLDHCITWKDEDVAVPKLAAYYDKYIGPSDRGGIITVGGVYRDSDEQWWRKWFSLSALDRLARTHRCLNDQLSQSEWLRTRYLCSHLHKAFSSRLSQLPIAASRRVNDHLQAMYRLVESWDRRDGHKTIAEMGGHLQAIMDIQIPLNATEQQPQAGISLVSESKCGEKRKAEEMVDGKQGQEEKATNKQAKSQFDDELWCPVCNIPAVNCSLFHNTTTEEEAAKKAAAEKAAAEKAAEKAAAEKAAAEKAAAERAAAEKAATEKAAAEKAAAEEAAAEEAAAAAAKERKKRAKFLWTWYRQVDQQTVMHMDGEEFDYAWKTLAEKAKELKDIRENPELLNLLASLHKQYLDGFTGKAVRGGQSK